MHRVEPQVYLVAEPRIVWSGGDEEYGFAKFLKAEGVPDWNSDALIDAERLVELMGRLCYRSWKPKLNPNVTKVREHNKDYIENILRVKHGSVIEHASVSFIFTNVSRVFTHELVRHRPGVAISQESLRFVRLEELGQWLPEVIREDEKAVEIFAHTFGTLEAIQMRLAEHFGLDEMKPCPDCFGHGQAPLSPVEKECSKCQGLGEVSAVPFSKKKEITSAMRRLAPIGLATAIGWTANFRTIRWCLEARSHPSAEEEIRAVFSRVGEIVTERYANMFGDFTATQVGGHKHWETPNSKV